MDVPKALEEATETGEVITIAYHGGSQPGATREIAPIKVNGDKVRARCYSSGTVKVFKIDKIEILSSTAAHPLQPDRHYDAERQEYESMPDLQRQKIEALRAMGWTIDQGDDFIALYDHFKNGKPRKTPALAIFFDDTTSEAVMVSGFLSDDDPWEFEAQTTEMAWRVQQRGARLASFKHLHKAAERFLDLSEKIPITRQ